MFNCNILAFLSCYPQQNDDKLAEENFATNADASVDRMTKSRKSSHTICKNRSKAENSQNSKNLRGKSSSTIILNPLNDSKSKQQRENDEIRDKAKNSVLPNKNNENQNKKQGNASITKSKQHSKAKPMRLAQLLQDI